MHRRIRRKSRKELKGKLNESALACAAQRGDREALRRLLEMHWSWLKGLAYNIVGNTEDMDEVLQNVCVLVLGNIEKVCEPERFKNWLATVAQNAALAYREQRSHKPIRLNELLAAEGRMSERSEVVEKVSRTEQCERILDALQKLPSKYREVFILKYMKDMSYADIVDILELSITTVQIRLVRARRMIYNQLTGNKTTKVPRT